jgi:hypothetical protein
MAFLRGGKREVLARMHAAVILKADNRRDQLTTHLKLPTTHLKLPTTHLKLPTTHLKLPTTHLKLPTTYSNRGKMGKTGDLAPSYFFNLSYEQWLKRRVYFNLDIKN